MAGSAQAQFTYNSGDVLVCFRNVASPTYDLIVDAGPVSTFTNMAIGSKKAITYSASQLAKVGTNNVAWSVCAAHYNYPVSDDTWLTKPRASLNTPTSPFNTGTPSRMSSLALDIDSGGLGNDATYISDTVINTATVVAETEAGHETLADVTGDCYYYWVGCRRRMDPRRPISAAMLREWWNRPRRPIFRPADSRCARIFTSYCPGPALPTTRPANIWAILSSRLTE